MSADQSSWRAPRRHALLVTTDEYEDDEWARLRSPAADAEGLAAALAEPAIGDFEVTTLANATSSEIRSALDEFLSDRTRDDFLLLYFSCHGYREDGEFYFAARDTLKRRLRATGVEGQFVHRLLRRSAADRVVVVLDCCYSGAFPKGAKGKALTTDVEYLTEIVSGTGRAIITASGSIENAYEDTGALISSNPVPSIFTEALIHGLRSGLADLDGDGHVAVNEWFEYATARLRRRGAVQTPHLWNAEIVGKLFVARNPFFRTLVPVAALVAATDDGDGILGRLALFTQRLPGGKALLQAVLGLLGQIRAVAQAARLPSAWWALLGSIEALSGDADADGAVRQLTTALLRLEKDPTAIETVAEILDGAETLLREPGVAGALGELVRALEIALGTSAQLLKRIVTPELSRRVYGVTHEFAIRFLVEPEQQPEDELESGADAEPGAEVEGQDGDEEPPLTPSRAATEVIEALYRLAHAVRGLTGYEALREAVGAYMEAFVPRRPVLAASSTEIEQLADQVLELTLSLRRWVEGSGAGFVRKYIIETCDSVSEQIRGFRAVGTHTSELIEFLEFLAEMLTEVIGGVTGPALIASIKSDTEDLRGEPLVESDFTQLLDYLAVLFDEWVEAVDQLAQPEE